MDRNWNRSWKLPFSVSMHCWLVPAMLVQEYLGCISPGCKLQQSHARTPIPQRAPHTSFPIRGTRYQTPYTRSQLRSVKLSIRVTDPPTRPLQSCPFRQSRHVIICGNQSRGEFLCLAVCAKSTIITSETCPRKSQSQSQQSINHGHKSNMSNPNSTRIESWVAVESSSTRTMAHIYDRSSAFGSILYTFRSHRRKPLERFGFDCFFTYILLYSWLSWIINVTRVHE